MADVEPSPYAATQERMKELEAELLRCREEIARLKRSETSSSAAQPGSTSTHAANGFGGQPASLGPGLPTYRRIQRRHTDLGDLEDVVRRRHSVDDSDVLRTTSLRGKQIHHSLGLWFLLANQLHSVDYSDQGETSNHLTTVSVANDGGSSVATAAAAAVSVALAKSWTAVGAGGPRKRLGAVSRSLSSDAPASSATMESGADEAVPRTHRTRFRLVAAIPKGPAKLLEAEERHERGLKSETSIPLERLDPKEDSASEWAAYGAHLKLQWMSKPKRVLVVFKLSHEARDAAVQAIRVLLREGVCVYVEPAQYDSVRRVLAPSASGDAGSADDRQVDCERLMTWELVKNAALEESNVGNNDGNKETALSALSHDDGHIPEDLGSMLDVIFTVGGDGTVLWVCSLLGTVASVPPIVAISMGSLGFMTPFPVSGLEKLCSSVISPERELPLLLRHRLQCRIVRKKAGNGDSAGDFSQLAAQGQTSGACDASNIVVLNEVVIDRGMTASLTKLECYIDGNYVTVIQGDGLIVSTPTGSTAYNLAAGGSMVHPAVPCILFTPICPHTLSSRPLVFPEHVVMRLKVPSDSRDDLSCSFDGKMRTALRPGDSVVVYSCQSPVPMVCHLDASHDFFSSVKEGLDWNRRVVQKKPQKI